MPLTRQIEAEILKTQGYNAITQTRKAAFERSRRGLGGEDTLCGKCIKVCYWSRLKKKE